MRSVLVALIIAGVALATPAFAASPLPQPTGYVNDYAGVLSAETRASLESELAAFNASTTNEVAVVTVPSMNGDYIEHYAVTVFKDWGIGTKKNNNGVLLLVAKEERKIRIEVGYGLEGALPDSVAQSIINNDITPALKNGDYDTGLTQGARTIMAATRGEYTASETQNAFDPIPFIFFGFIALQWLAAILARSKSVWLGGLIGLGAGIALSSIFGWWVFNGVLTTVLLVGLGTAFDMAVSAAYQGARASGVTPPWWTGGSGGFGSGSGGGFGGFGGGSSGGGGASGSY